MKFTHSIKLFSLEFLIVGTERKVFQYLSVSQQPKEASAGAVRSVRDLNL